jgi:hypothetical protein
MRSIDAYAEGARQAAVSRGEFGGGLRSCLSIFVVLVETRSLLRERLASRALRESVSGRIISELKYLPSGVVHLEV